MILTAGVIVGYVAHIWLEPFVRVRLFVRRFRVATEASRSQNKEEK